MKKTGNFLPLGISNSQLTENQRFSEPKNALAFSGIQFSRIEDFKKQEVFKMTSKKNKIGIVFLFGILILLIPNILAAAYYSQSNTMWAQPGISTFKYLQGQGIDIYPALDKAKCGAGQDLLIQIDPAGCQPSVIRSDLLEEQNVPVFCPLVATKINPLIDIKTINSITLQKQSGDSGFQGVGFQPASAAIAGPQTYLNSPVLGNIGYAIIVLKQNKNESSMPDYVSGAVHADIKYDIQNAFGTGSAVYYLPVMSDEDWNLNYKQYGFWKGKGYLRAQTVDNNKALVSIYQDQNTIFGGVNLNQGQLSEDIYMPGYYCLARIQLKLESVESPDTRAVFTVNNADIFEVKEKEQFLDNKCTVSSLSKIGIVDKTTVQCDDDQKSKPFQLIISPKIKLKICDANECNENDYQVGDKLYVSDNANKYVYLAGAYSKQNSNKPEDLHIFLIQAPIHDEKLSVEVISSMKSVFDNYLNTEEKKSTGAPILDFIITGGKGYIDTTKEVWKWLIEGKTVESVKYGKQVDYAGAKVSVLGYGDAKDKVISNDFKKSFDSAIKQYEALSQQFPQEQITETSDFKTYAEKGLWEAQELAESTSQYATRKQLLEEFIQKYPDSKFIEDAKTELESYQNSNSEINTASIIIDGQTKIISFERVIQPSPDDYGTVINVNDEQFTLGKNERIYVNDVTNEYIELLEVKDNSIRVSLTGIQHSSKTNWLYDRQNAEIKLNDFLVVGDKQYKITVNKINLKKLAKVSLNPNLDYQGTETNFTFKIGIEKRAIQLSPEKIKSRIDNMNEQLTKWTSISDNLNKLTENMNKVCLYTETYYTVSNFFANANGKSIARQKVMRGKGGWTDFCTNQVSQEKYVSMDSCFYENADSIDRDVDQTSKIIQAQNDKIKSLEKDSIDSTPAGDVVNQNKYMPKYIPQVTESLDKIPGGSVTDGKNTINIADIKNSLTFDAWNKSLISQSELRDIDLYSQIIAEGSSNSHLKQMAEKELYSTLSQVQADTKTYDEAKIFVQELGVSVDDCNFISEKGYNPESYKNKVYSDIEEHVIITGDNGMPINGNTPIAIIPTSSGGQYIATLVDQGAGKYSITKVYDLNGNAVDKQFKIYFQKYDSSSYQNKILNPEIKYFETAPYKGKPAIVPFDTKNGWYAAAQQTIPILGNTATYTQAGVVTSLWLCNVGRNGKAEFDSGIADDNCQLIDLTHKQNTQFSGLSSEQFSKLVDNAVNAISQAERAYGSGVQSVPIKIGSETYKIPVGEPATNVPEMQCQDFMSPKDCYILFNVCDPVICPSSRCDLGGTYHVPDVIQSGIIGSIALCFPNYKEGILMPVCLSGINAGVQNLVSMFSSYRDCLQESLNSGKQIGICDEVHSIYLCEFFWRQAAPLSNIAIPKILQAITGQGTRGGGEYLGIANAWTNAQNSIAYLTQYYGANSYKAFKARTTEDVGSAACKNFISAKYPAGGDFLDALTSPDSPVQYSAWFSEIPFTTATNPPISQYKVYFHIYAGQNEGSYYKVYLKSASGSSYYGDNPSLLIASGYLGVGQYEDKTRDLTAAANYQQLCISINAQEECGFKEVSTSFLSDYVKDKYVQEQANKTDIKTQKDCVSGSPSVYSLANPNIQEGANQVVNPSIADYGITRICATNDPGQGTDANAGGENARWVSVGYCDSIKIKCWLDTKSVTDVVKITSIAEQTVEDARNNFLDAIQKAGGYLTTAEINTEVEKLKTDVGANIGEGSIDDTKLNNAVTEIESVISKVLLSNDKANFLGFKARAYNKLARNIFNAISKVAPASTTPEAIPSETEKTNYQPSPGQVYPIFEYKDGAIATNLYYTYDNNFGWTWTSEIQGAMPGANVWRSVKNSNAAEINLNQDQKNLLNSLSQLDYKGGLNLLIIKTFTDSGTLWIKPTLSTDKVDLSSKRVFTLKQGVFNINIYLRYNPTDKSWEWSSDKVDWDYEIKSYSRGEWIPVKSFNTIYKSTYAQEQTARAKDLIDYLINSEGKTLTEGAVKIFSINTLLTTESVSSDRKDISYNFKKRDVAEMITLINYAKLNTIVDRKCNCGENCASYAELLVDASNNNNIPDPLLLLSIMMQESSCGLSLSSGSSHGLMQINLLHCGEYNLPSDETECKNLLLQNPQVNIETGAEILKEYYNTYKNGRLFSRACSDSMKSTVYYNWEAAVRAYNGWGCNKDYPQQDNYVNNVIDRYTQLASK